MSNIDNKEIEISVPSLDVDNRGSNSLEVLRVLFKVIGILGIIASPISIAFGEIEIGVIGIIASLLLFLFAGMSRGLKSVVEAAEVYLTEQNLKYDIHKRKEQ